MVPLLGTDADLNVSSICTKVETGNDNVAALGSWTGTMLDCGWIVAELDLAGQAVLCLDEELLVRADAAGHAATES